MGSPDLDLIVIERIEHACEVEAHSVKRLHHHARVPRLDQQLFGERDVELVEHVLRATGERHGRPLQQELGRDVRNRLGICHSHQHAHNTLRGEGLVLDDVAEDGGHDGLVDGDDAAQIGEKREIAVITDGERCGLNATFHTPWEVVRCVTIGYAFVVQQRGARHRLMILKTPLQQVPQERALLCLVPQRLQMKEGRRKNCVRFDKVDEIAEIDAENLAIAFRYDRWNGVLQVLCNLLQLTTNHCTNASKGLAWHLHQKQRKCAVRRLVQLYACEK